MAIKKSKSMDKMPARKMPESVKMPYKPSGKPKTETMPYKPSNRGGASAGPVPSEISKGETRRETRRADSSSTNEKTSRTMSMAKKQALKPAATDKKAATFRAAAGNPMAKPTAKAPAKTTKAPTKTTPKPKVTKNPSKMTPQDAAMKKLLEKKYGKIYG